MTQDQDALLALATELDEEFRCHCEEAFTGRGMHAHDCQAYMQPHTSALIRKAAATIRAQAAEIARLSTPAGAAGVLLGVADTGMLADLHHAVMDMIGVAAGHDDESKVIDGVLDGLRALAAKEPAHD